MDSLPDDINMNQLLMNHLTEIETLRKASNVKKRCAVFQSIPREMRRRAASNNPKRRPKSIQWGVLPVKKKANVKRYRKSRMKTKSRLPLHTPLHMWFTKRFVQSEKWGKLLPEYNNLKNRRLLFRTLSTGFSVFFMPHLKTFTIELGSEISSHNTLIDTFKRHCLPEHVKLVEELSSMGEAMIHIFEKPNILLGPCRVTVIKSEKNPALIRKCVMTTHIQIYEKMHSLFKEAIDNLGSVDHSDIFHIRIFGPNCQKTLKRRLFQRDHAFPPNEQFGILAVKADDSLTEELMIKQFFEMKDPKAKPTAESELQLLLLKCSSKCDISTVHLMVQQSQLKLIWNAIVDNCNIHVGGWRDLKDLSLNRYLPVFPEIGYLDALNEKETVIRDGKVLSSDNGEDNESRWVYASLQYEFGCAEDNQGLYLLNEKCLEELYNNNDNVRLRQIQYGKLEDSNAVGYIEFGGYSMKEGKSIAIGRFNVNNWNRIVKSNNVKNITAGPAKGRRMFVLGENKCKQLYLITVSRLVPNIDNPFNL